MKKLGNTLLCICGVAAGIGFTIKGINEGGPRIIFGPFITLLNIWFIYMIWKDNDDSWY